MKDPTAREREDHPELDARGESAYTVFRLADDRFDLTTDTSGHYD